METWEEVSESVSCRSSVISDLDELEANLYSYVHHERNFCFDEERSAECCVSQLEEVCQNIGSKESTEHIVITSASISNAAPQSFEENSECPTICEIGRNDEIAESADKVTRVEADGVIPLEIVTPPNLLSETSKYSSGGVSQDRCSSPPVVDLSSSDDDPMEKMNSKYGLAAASTPYKECVVIDDSDQEIRIELERVKVKPIQPKKRKKLDIRTDIQLNTQRRSETVSLDCDNDHIFPEIDQVDPLLSSDDFDTSNQESSLSKSWTPQMVKFYEESWGGEYINVYEIQRSMTDHGWEVDISDEFYSLTSKIQGPRYFGNNSRAWCSQCNRKGHFKSECKVKQSTPRCHRCGSSTHREYSCNKNICLTCGKRWPFLVIACKQCRQHSMKKCQVCRQPGHPPSCCPDLWRRFHATVLPGKIVTPPKVLYKDPRNAYCCNCASRGHHVYQCKQNSYSDYVPISPHVTSYLDPEMLLQLNSSCNSPSSNWDQFGRADRWDAETNEYSEKKKSIKRVKTSDHLRKAKQIKLNDNFVPYLKKNIESNGGKKHTTEGPDNFEKKRIKIAPRSKVKQCGLKHMKNSYGQNQDDVFIGDKNSEKSPKDLKAAKEIEYKDTLKSSAKETLNMAVSEVPGILGNDSNSSSRSVERIVILSPAQLNRLKSDEGQEILRCITSQFEGVSARVSGSPSGVERLTSGTNIEVLRLNGAGNNVDNVKLALFQILNKSKGLDQWRKSLDVTSSSTQTRIQKKKNKVSSIVVDKSKMPVKQKNRISGQKENQGKAKKKGNNALLNAKNTKEIQTGNPPCKNKSKLNSKDKSKSTKTYDKKCNFPDKNREQKSENRITNPVVNPTDTHKGKSDCISRSKSKDTKDKNTVLSIKDKSCGTKDKLDEQCPKAVKVKNSKVASTRPKVVPVDGQPKQSIANYKSNGLRKNKKEINAPTNPPSSQDKLRNVQGGGGKKGKRRNSKRCKRLKKKIVDNLKKRGNGIVLLGNIQVEVGNSNITGINRKVCFVKESKNVSIPNILETVNSRSVISKRTNNFPG